MDLLIDILLDAGKDTLSLVPFLLVTYLALETLEHVAATASTALSSAPALRVPWLARCWAWCRSADFRPWQQRCTPAVS